MKVRILGLLIVYSLFQFLSVNSKIYAISINESIDMKFANTLSVEHNSDVLYNDIRTKHSTIGNEPAYAFNEKLQAFLIFENNNPISCFINIPSNSYVSINAIYIHNENYALCSGIEGELGFGYYRNPFFSAGIGFSYQHDMVFNVSKNDDYGTIGEINCFFSIGYRDDIHFYLDFTPGALGGTGINRPFLKIDTALGYKQFSRFFIRFYGDIKENRTGYPEEGEYDYSYEYLFAFLHIEYYGETFGLSVGITGVDQKYSQNTYNSITGEVDDEKIDSLRARGGGTTFYINNIGSCVNLFGEFHMLKGDNSNWMSISKFGAKIYF